MVGRVLVVNATAQAVNHLACRLALDGDLLKYIRVYANQGRFWERALEQIPGIDRIYARTFGRRSLPAPLLGGRLHAAGIMADFASALAGRLGPAGQSLARAMTLRFAQRIEKVGARYAPQAGMVVASYLVALTPFQQTAGLKVLHYPIAHHRYIRRFSEEEAEREPAFAMTLPDWKRVPEAEEAKLDAECELADRILVGSTFARDSFISEGIPEEKLIVVPYGVDVERFSPPAPDAGRRNGLRVLFVGQIGQRKGISYLLRAYERFYSPGASLTLVGNFYGDSEPFRPYRHLFKHIPNVPQIQLAELYRQADVFVFPTLIEGMGLVFLEAMASGLPVIVTPNGPGDIVRNGVDGFVVPPRDVDAIVDCLEYLRANPEIRKQMGRNARERASRFTWDAYSTRAVGELANLLEVGGLAQSSLA
jgi:glycosyltransferase involved in cell wall biosynthesis